MKYANPNQSKPHQTKPATQKIRHTIRTSICLMLGCGYKRPKGQITKPNYQTNQATKQPNHQTIEANIVITAKQP
jgi:hypothetical protein